MSDTIEQAARVFYEARRKATGLDIHGAVEVRWDDLPEAMKDEYRAGFQALHEAGMLVGGEPVAWRYRCLDPESHWLITDSALTNAAITDRPNIWEVQALVPLPTEDRSDG